MSSINSRRRASQTLLLRQIGGGGRYDDDDDEDGMSTTALTDLVGVGDSEDADLRRQEMYARWVQDACLLIMFSIMANAIIIASVCSSSASSSKTTHPPLVISCSSTQQADECECAAEKTTRSSACKKKKRKKASNCSGSIMGSPAMSAVDSADARESMPGLGIGTGTASAAAAAAEDVFMVSRDEWSAFLSKCANGRASCSAAPSLEREGTTMQWVLSQHRRACQLQPLSGADWIL